MTVIFYTGSKNINNGVLLMSRTENYTRLYSFKYDQFITVSTKQLEENNTIKRRPNAKNYKVLIDGLSFENLRIASNYIKGRTGKHTEPFDLYIKMIRVGNLFELNGLKIEIKL